MQQQVYPARGTWMRVTPLSLLALIAVYLAIMLGEFVAGSGLAARLLGGRLGIIPLRLTIHMLITVPIAYGVGYSLVRYDSVAGSKAVSVCALLWTALILIFQLTIYEPYVAGASVLKVLFVVVPLFVGRSIAHRVLAKKARA